MKHPVLFEDSERQPLSPETAARIRASQMELYKPENHQIARDTGAVIILAIAIVSLAYFVATVLMGG